MNLKARCSAFLLALVMVQSLPPMHAQANTIRIDASQPALSPAPVQAALGTASNPRGDTIGVNSQYLTFNGKPWLPVMGEFHFSRYPEAQWEQEILKMKSAGIQIISAYIIWIHHEQVEGTFDWQGQRDLRHFTELCTKHGLYVYPRIGPWAHAEVRNGGLPDWVLKNGPTRQNDPTYLKEVQTFYAQIALQLHGLLWKDGGPVIGLQVENEYRDRGPGKGEEHIRTLKQMAVADGLDVPLYTVTGWDGAAVPLDAVLPVFGGYPDAPWDGSSKQLPPNEVYAFRFANRSAGTMGAIGGRGQSPASVYRGTPFLTAEVGDGIEDTYFRRPVVSPDDVAAIAPIMLGSGANLLGYYMFHGGRNPDSEPSAAPIPLQESQLTSYPTDVPVRSYDFQAPMGEFGQARESLRKLKLIHYFLADFGDLLAPMQPHAPATIPADPADTQTPRVSARTLGNSGFIFFSNYVRNLAQPARPGFQVELKLPNQSLGSPAKIPAEPLNLPAGAYGIWPVNLQLPGTLLRYSTAQLFKRVQVAGETYFFFFAIPGVAPEFAFDAQSPVTTSATIRTLHSDSLQRLLLDPTRTTELHLPQAIHLVLLPQSLAEQVWRVDDPSLLLATNATAYADGPAWTLDSDAQNKIGFAIFGAGQQPPPSAVKLQKLSSHELFQPYTATLPVATLKPIVTPLHDASARAPWKLGAAFDWRPQPIALAPDDHDFAGAAAWKIALPPIPASLSDAFLTIDYQGDAARLYSHNHLLDDQFWNGTPWSIGLRELTSGPDASTPYELRILPLPSNYPMYLEQANKLRFNAQDYADLLESIRIIPQYRLHLQAPDAPCAKPECARTP